VRHYPNCRLGVATALALVLALPAFGLAQGTPVAAPLLIVPGQGIGPIRLGMTMAQVRAALGHEQRSSADPLTGITILAWETKGGGRLGVWFGPDGKAINVGINHDSRYATAQGLRSGDGADRVRGAMGAPVRMSSVPSATFGRFQVLQYPGILFYIPSGATDPKLNDKVYSIVVGGPAAPPAAPSAAPPAQTPPASTQAAPAVQPAPPAPGPTAAPSQASPASAPAPQTPLANDRLYVVRIGPVSDSDRASTIVAQLSAAGFPQAQVSTQTGYRVISEPLPRKEAEDLVGALAARGVHAYLGPSTSDTVQIVFGAFTSQKDAEERSNRIAAAGYDAWVREGTVYTVRVGPYPSASVAAITGVIKNGAPEATVSADPVP
jgi:cell division septation protein DedD